jgi:hypothetical protein
MSLKIKELSVDRSTFACPRIKTIQMAWTLGKQKSTVTQTGFHVARYVRTSRKIVKVKEGHRPNIHKNALVNTPHERIIRQEPGPEVMAGEITWLLHLPTPLHSSSILQSIPYYQLATLLKHFLRVFG